MRVAVITYHAVCNFGANLQALASTRTLQRLGHEVCLLDYQPPALAERYRRDTPPDQAEAHRHFVHAFLPLSPRCADQDAVTRVARDFRPDAVVAGSDAVFFLPPRPSAEETGRHPNPFFLDWAGALGARRAALSASSQGAFFPRLDKATRRGVARSWAGFDFLSARDRWTQRMIVLMTAGRRWPVRTPDPVLNLEAAFDLPAEDEQEPASLHRRYLLMMPRPAGNPGHLDDAWVRRFVELAHQRDLQVFALPMPGYTTDIPVDRVLPHPMSPLAWYAWIKHAAGYVGTLFHPIVSALATGTPLLSVDQYADTRVPWRSKVYDLLMDAKMTAAHVPARQAHTLTPEAALATLENRDLQARSTAYRDAARRRFESAIARAVGGRS